MKIVLADFAGFCHGVLHTIKSIEDLLLSSPDTTISCIGLPVHNQQVTNKLVDAGLRVVNDIKDIDAGILVIRAHGLSPKLIREAQKKGLKIVDTTCGIVSNVQQIAKKLIDDDYLVVIAGESKHPEVKSIFGYTDEKAHICSSLDDLRKVKLCGKIGIVSQTTFSRTLYAEMINYLTIDNFNELRIFNTLCHSIAKRSVASVEVAKKSDLMMVIGGRMSSNTKRLFEACKCVNVNTYHIETKEDIEPSWFAGSKEIGITAGASTPQWIIDDTVNFIKNL